MTDDWGYTELVDRLLFVDPRRLSREVSSIPGLDAARLHAAFSSRARALAAEGRREELELVVQVRDSVARTLAAHKPAGASAFLRRAGRLLGAKQPFRRARPAPSVPGDSSDRRWAAKTAAAAADAGGDGEAAVRGLAGLLEEAEREGDSAHATAARATLARVLSRLGRDTEALGMFDTALAGLEEAGQGQARETIELRRFRALTLDNLGRYDEGEAEFDRLSQLAAGLGDNDLTFTLRADAGFSALKRHDSRTALRRFWNILRETERRASVTFGLPLDANPTQLADACNNLGNALLDAQRPGEAREQFERAWSLRLSRGIGGKGAAISLAGLADTAEPDEAAGYLAVGLMEWLRTGDEEILRAVLVRMAVHDIDDETLGVLERAVTRGSSGLLSKVLADQHVRRGDSVSAERVLRTARRNALAADRWSSDSLRHSIQLGALLAGDPGRRDEAYALLRGAVDDVSQRVREATLDQRRGEIVTDWIDAFANLIQLLMARGSGPALEEAFAVHEAAKAQGLAATLAAGALKAPSTVPQDLRDREQQLLATHRALERNVVNGAGDGLAVRFARIASVRGQLAACWQEIGRHAPEYVAFRQGESMVTTERLRALLAQSVDVPAAFVSFFCGDQRTTIFVVRSDDSQLRVFEAEASRDELEAAVAALRRAYNGDPGAFPPIAPIRRTRPSARALPELDAVGERLLREFEREVAGCQLLCLAPHGPLHGLPLHALAVGRGRGVLADRHGVVYVPSAAALTYMLSQAPRIPKTAAVAGVAAVGDRHPEHLEHDDELFTGTLQPSRTAAGLAAQKGTVRDLFGEEDIVHITCHGSFNAVNPMASGLMLSDGATRPPNQIGALSVTERARFVLTAQELAEAPTGARLVALRACSTGVQADRGRGDELEGLTRAAIAAGATTVAVNLWNTDQRSSRALLAAFYRHWLSPASPKPAWRALWLAQQELRAALNEPYLNHPYHWASLVLVGDWR